MNEPRSIPSVIAALGKEGASAKARAREITRERRYAAIEAVLKKTPKMMQDRDRRIVARQLHDILEEFQKRTGRKKEEVLRAAHVGGLGDSTKQLYNYTLPPEGETEQRISKLIQHTHKYRLIAEKAAELARWNSKETLIELFQGSSYDDSTQAFDSLPEEYLFTMYDILDRMKNWLLRNSEIEWYFKTLHENPVIDDLGNFVFDAPTGYQLDFGAFHNEWYDKAIPGVPLYRILGSEFEIEFAFGENEGFKGPPDELFEQGTFRRLFEVRLGLAPVGPSKKIDIVFDERRFDQIWIADELRCYTNLVFTPPFFKRQAHANFSTRKESDTHKKFDDRAWEFDTYCNLESPVEICSWLNCSKGGGSDGYMRFKAFDDETFPPPRVMDETEQTAGPSQLKDEIDYSEYVGQAFSDQLVEPADLKTCRKYLGRRESLLEWRGAWAKSPRIPTESPWETVAAQIEANLYSGDEENRIDTMLMKEVRHHCAMLKECLERRRGLVDENKYRLYARYSIDDEDQ
jgi:hypothetical protein